jgi:catechol 2,3-dioxygenase-like lactoylglutathione lyase family enzyme
LAIERMEHVDIVVEHLAAAIDFFAGLGLEVQGETTVEGDWADCFRVDDVDAAVLRARGGELVGAA